MKDKNDNEAMSKKVRVWLLENGKVRLHSRDEADELADTVTACVLHFAAKSQPVDENGLKAGVDYEDWEDDMSPDNRRTP